MSHKKAGGSANSFSDSNAQYLGVKLSDGQFAQHGAIIVRQRGTDVLPGDHVGTGKDHTLFALTDGTVKFSTKRKKHFNGSIIRKKIVHIVPAETATA